MSTTPSQQEEKQQLLLGAIGEETLQKALTSSNIKQSILDFQRQNIVKDMYLIHY